MADFADLNGSRVFEGRVAMPAYGLWTADVRIVSGSPLPTAGGALTLSMGDLNLVATALRQSAYGGVISVRMVGGYGGWRKPLSAKHYAFAAGVPLSMILGDAAIEAGEKITGIPSGTVGPGYVRAALPASFVLAQLATPSWYMAPNGVTTVGARPSTPITSTFQIIDYSPEQGRVVVAADSLADFAPGRTFTAPTLPTPTPISYVEHVMGEGGIVRTEILLA